MTCHPVRLGSPRAWIEKKAFFRTYPDTREPRPAEKPEQRDPPRRVLRRKTLVEADPERLHRVPAVLLELALQLLGARDAEAPAHDAGHGLDNVERRGRVLVGAAQPYRAPPARPVDAVHDLDLARLLVQVCLVDAHGVGPERAGPIRPAQLGQGIEEIRGDAEGAAAAAIVILAAARYLPGRRGIAPDVREGLKVGVL